MASNPAFCHQEADPRQLAIVKGRPKIRAIARALDVSRTYVQLVLKEQAAAAAAAAATAAPSPTEEDLRARVRALASDPDHQLGGKRTERRVNVHAICRTTGLHRERVLALLQAEPGAADAPAVPTKPARRVTAAQLRAKGIEPAVIQRWLRQGVLQPSGVRGEYLKTPATGKAIAAHRARLAEEPEGGAES
mgnify:CR=1 FL=1